MPDRFIETWGCKQCIELMTAALDHGIELGQGGVDVAGVAHDEVAGAAGREEVREFLIEGNVEIERRYAGETVVRRKPRGIQSVAEPASQGMNDQGFVCCRSPPENVQHVVRGIADEWKSFAVAVSQNLDQCTANAREGVDVLMAVDEIRLDAEGFLEAR